MAWLSRVTTSAALHAGEEADPERNVNPGMLAASATVGVSGEDAARCAEETASSFTWPLRQSSSAAGNPRNRGRHASRGDRSAPDPPPCRARASYFRWSSVAAARRRSVRAFRPADAKRRPWNHWLPSTDPPATRTANGRNHQSERHDAAQRDRHQILLRITAEASHVILIDGDLGRLTDQDRISIG